MFYFVYKNVFYFGFFYILGLKREHKDNLELLQKDHDEALFKLRGQQATSVEYYIEKIQGVISHKISKLKIYLSFYQNNNFFFGDLRIGRRTSNVKTSK